MLLQRSPLLVPSRLVASRDLRRTRKPVRATQDRKHEVVGSLSVHAQSLSTKATPRYSFSRLSDHLLIVPSERAPPKQPRYCSSRRCCEESEVIDRIRQEPCEADATSYRRVQDWLTKSLLSGHSEWLVESEGPVDEIQVLSLVAPSWYTRHR